MRLAAVAVPTQRMITNAPVRKRAHIGKRTCSLTTLKPEVVAEPTASNPEVIVELARATSVLSASSWSASSS